MTIPQRQSTASVLAVYVEPCRLTANIVVGRLLTMRIGVVIYKVNECIDVKLNLSNFTV